MNIKQVDNPRLVIWMNKIGITETPRSYSDYIAFINASATRYTKEKGINNIIDHDDFTDWLKNI